MDRRFKRVEIAAQVLIDMLKAGALSVVDGGLPEDARIKSCYFDTMFSNPEGVVVLVVESATYDEVPLCTHPPRAPMMMFRNLALGSQGGPTHDYDGEARNPMFRRYQFPVKRDLPDPTLEPVPGEHELIEPGDDPSRAE